MFSLLLLAGLASAVSAATLRFDMGTGQSPVAPGFIRVTADTQFNARQGYGWESTGQAGFDVPRPPENPGWHQPAGQVIPKDYVQYKEHNDVTRDGVRSSGDLIFRANVPNGIYRVAITLGRLDQPLCSQQVEINGRLVAADVNARHFVQRGRPDFQYGFPKKVRRTVTVAGGSLRVRVYGDDRAFRARFEAEHQKPAPSSYLTGGPREDRKPPKPDVSRWGQGRGVIEVWVWEDIGGPFTENAINAIEIYPYADPPLVWREGRLQAAGSDASLQRGADHFNAARWGDAEKAFDAVADEYARALGYMWLAGRPQYEEELRLVPKALALLERQAAARSDDLLFGETLESARRMDRLLHRFVHRADEHRTYTELLLISGDAGFIEPDDPLYYKARIYAARGFYMIIPHRWAFTAGAGRQIFEELEKAGFAGNRYVRWYLHDEWSSQWPEWAFPDYSGSKQGAPAWAAAIHEAYNRELDLAEWWMRHRRRADGSLGGSWGDDVEVLRSFGAFAATSPDASPLTLDGIRGVADGAWNSGSIDTEAGYFAEVDDTEHSGEWTADTLVAMIRVDYGNPVYIERALKTGKLMRDLWMDYNSQGHFLVRSNFLGATGVGGPGTQNDSRINYRPLSPAMAVLRYNNLPALRKMFLAWADAWLAASLSTGKNKPRGIIPQEIGFAASEMGGTNAPTWYKADNPPGKDSNYDWEGAGGYHEAMVELFQLAYKTTGDRKYLEPMELEAAFVKEHCPTEVRESGYVKQGRLHPSLWSRLPPGSHAWTAARLATWPRTWEASQRERGDLRSLSEAAAMAAEENEWSRKRWPHVTTESIATDRIYFRGLGNAVRVMTAYGVEGQRPLVTYRGLGRDFAAVVLRAGADRLKVVLYNLAAEPKDAAVVPWALEVGAEYTLRAGNESRRFQMMSFGQEIPFRLPPRTEFTLEIDKAADGSRPALLADLALSAQDVKFVPEYRRVDVAVHNIGSVAARRVTVALLEGGQEVGRQVIPNIEAPLDLDAKLVRVGFPFQPKAASHRFTVIVDPDGAIDEITKRNNRVTVEVPTPAAPKKQHSSA